MESSSPDSGAGNFVLVSKLRTTPYPDPSSKRLPTRMMWSNEGGKTIHRKIFRTSIKKKKKTKDNIRELCNGTRYQTCSKKVLCSKAAVSISDRIINGTVIEAAGSELSLEGDRIFTGRNERGGRSRQKKWPTEKLNRKVHGLFVEQLDWIKTFIP